MGVFPPGQHGGQIFCCLPHARGGVSWASWANDIRLMSSPRTWGCFHADGKAANADDVFPTHVGVFPKTHSTEINASCLPHARGGVSGYWSLAGGTAPSSPRTWGCFSLISANAWVSPVFPTHVGVFPRVVRWRAFRLRLPHARGGVSVSAEFDRLTARSSPRTWGCFLGPAPRAAR